MAQRPGELAGIELYDSGAGFVVPRSRVEEIVSEARRKTLGTVSGRHILAIQGTTTLRDDGGGRGIVAHPLIAVDAGSGALLGLVHAEFIFRDGGLRASRKTRPLADNQSHRWLEGAAQAASVTVIADREGDIYGAFADRPQGVDLLVRASHNRYLEAGGRLFDCTQALEEAGRMRLSLPAAPGRRARDLTLLLRYCQVRLKRPRGRVQGPDQPETTPVYLVEAREVSPPPGIRAAHWRLLTTHSVHMPEAARTMVRYYRERWIIEQLFRVLKTKGFDIEAVRISDEEPFQKFAAACLVAAISVLQLVRDHDGLARRPLSDVFQPDDLATPRALSKELEGKTARQKNPHPPDALAFAAWVCARLGGWTGYYGKPGPIVMLNGLQQFKAIQQGWSLAQYVRIL